MNTGETIALIKAFGNGGSGSLPSVTSADNGKVLAVKDGAWAADANSFVVTYNGTTADKTYAQIREAVLAGKNVYCVYGNIVHEFSGISNFGNSTTERINFASFSNSTQYHYLNFIIAGQIYRGATSNIPSTTNSDNGSELIVKNGAWTKQKKKFIVTLTPEELDYSGTMDKTVAEINAAYEARQEIWFKVLTSATSYVEVPVSFLGKDTSFDYPNFGAEIIKSDANLMIVAQTLDTSDGTKQTYSTNIYTLTPAS